MKLYEIIEANDQPDQSILSELLVPYKKALLTYYRDLFCCEPVLMVTDVFNAAQYAKIVPVDEFSEAIEDYLADRDLSEEDKEAEAETINFNSVLFQQL